MSDMVSDEELDGIIALNGDLLEMEANKTVGEDAQLEDRNTGSWRFWQRWFQCNSGERINLPEPRLVSTEFHPDDSVEDPDFTLMVMQFGQFLDHDLTLTAESEAMDEEGNVVDCCENPLVRTRNRVPSEK